MSTQGSFIAEWAQDVREGKLTRRMFARRLAALGLTGPAVGALTAGLPWAASAAASDPTTLLIATPETPPGLDTEYNGSRSSHEGIAQTVDTLVQFDKKVGADGLLYSDFTNLKGALAESWDADPGGKGVTFHLRKGVMSHWGNELTSEDVFYAWNRAFQLKSNRMSTFVRMKMKDPATAIKMLDKYTVRFEYDAPRSIGVIMHSSIYVGIQDASACKANSTEADPWAKDFVGKNGAGFGPYYVETWQPGQQVVFRAHEGYWRGAPAIKRVIVRSVPNSANRLALIQTGAVDVAQWLLPNELMQLSNNPAVKLSSFRSNFQVIYSLNTKKEPFDNPKVRQAFKWAYPYDAVLKTVFMGMAEPCKSLVPSVFPDSNETQYPYTTDLDRARQLLKEAGFPDGFKTSLTYNTEIAWDEQMAILTQTNLKKIGVEATLNKLPGGPYFDQEWGKQLTTYFFEDQPNVPAAEYALYAFANSSQRGNHTSYSNPEIDRLTEAALGELDPAKRQKLNYEAQRILGEDGALVFIARPPLTLAMNPSIKGARWYPAEHIRWDELTKG